MSFRINYHAAELGLGFSKRSNIMKSNICSIIVIAFSISCAPQLTIMNPTDVIFQEIINIDSEKNELYTKTITWMAESFNSSKEVIEYKNIDDGKIIGNTILSVNISNGPMDFYRDIKMTIIIEIKNESLRFTAKNFIIQSMYIGGGKLPEEPVIHKEIFYKIIQAIDGSLIKSLRSYLQKSSDNDNW